MNKRTKSRLVSLIFVLVCSCTALGFLYLFWQDLNSYTVRTDKKCIANISFKRNIAQRKFNDRVVWERLRQDGPLYSMDTLRIAQSAEAVIKFKTNTVLSIEENTMLQISENSDGTININVNSGSVVVDTSDSTGAEPAVRLSMNGGPVINLFSGSKLYANTENNDGRNFVQLYNGSASAQSGRLEAEQGVVFNQNGEIVKKTISVTSLSGDITVLRFENEKTKNILLKWKKAPGYENQSVRLETSRDKNFEKLETSEFIVDRDSAEIQNAAGKLFWRVYIENDIQGGASGRVNVRPVKNVKIISPVARASFEYKTRLPEIKFLWEGNDFASGYKFELFRAGNTTKSVTELFVEESSVKLDNLEQGNYQWRVTPFYEMYDKAWGEPTSLYNLSIVKKDAVTVPELVMPLDNARFTVENSMQQVSFNWKSDAVNSSYVLLVDTSSAFNNPVVSAETDGNKINRSFNIKTSGEGKYYWKVLRKDKKSGREESSAVRSFSLNSYHGDFNKLLYPNDGFVSGKGSVRQTRFTWKLSDKYKNNFSSVIQFSEKEDFAGISFEKSVEDRFAEGVILEPGKYFWRIYPDADTDDYSDVYRIKVTGTPSAPVFNCPGDFTLSPKEKVRLSWKSRKAADYYIVKYRDISAKSGKEVSEKIKKDYYEFTPSGLKTDSWKEYRVSVQTVVEIDGEVFVSSETEKIIRVKASQQEASAAPVKKAPAVKKTETLARPVPVSPENGLVMGPSYLRKNRVILFDWKNVEGATDYVFELFKTGPKGELTRIAVEKTTKSQLNFKDLSKLDIGTFQWQVTAYTHSRSGVEVRRSKASKSVFKIDFNAPSKVEVIKQGTQYGE